jgi:hypothetical protein
VPIREDDMANPNYNGEFLAHELLSNSAGEIFYENMPEGDYVIKYRTNNGVDLGSYEMGRSLKRI